MEAKSIHIGFNALTIKVFSAITIASLKFNCCFLPLKNADAIHTPVSAFLASEHGLAESIVIIQSRRAHWVCCTDPLCGCTRNHCVLLGGMHDFISTRADVEFALLAKCIAGAVTLKWIEKEGFKKGWSWSPNRLEKCPFTT